MKPYVSERVCWMVRSTPCSRPLLRAPDGRRPERARHYSDHPFYDDCVEFCEHFDQNCFDPGYDSLPLEFFRPIVEQVFGGPRYAADELPVTP